MPVGEGLVAREDEHYRRGVVLGLTIAEITILLLFCLLMANVLLLQNKQNRIEQLESIKRAKFIVSPTVLASIEATYGPATSQAEIDNNFQKLITAAGEAKEIETRLAGNGIPVTAPANVTSTVQGVIDIANVGGKVVSASNQPTNDIPAVKAGLNNLIPFVSEFPQWQTQQPRDNSPGTNSDPRAAMAGTLCAFEYKDARQLDECRKKVVELVGGKGLEFQSCWWDKSTVPWKTKNIYEIALTERGYIFRDIDPGVAEYQQQKQNEFGVAAIPMEREVSADQFLPLTDELFRWSEAHKCRFYALVFDETGPSSKAIFKKRLATLEEHFYKELTDGDFFINANGRPQRP